MDSKSNQNHLRMLCPLMRQVIFVAVLSCLIARTTADCEVGTATASGTCDSAGAVAGAASTFLCADPTGIGCALISIATTAFGICSAVAGNIDCGGGMDPGKKFNQTIRFVILIFVTVFA